LGLRASVFATLADKIRHPPAGFLPLHIGDTCLPPPEAARLDRLDWSRAPNPYPYSHPAGLPELLEHLAGRLAEVWGFQGMVPERLQITCGATHALSCAARTVLNPGDEVLILAPFWPLIPGVLSSAGLVAVQVPFSDRLYADPGCSVVDLLAPYLSARTAALYFASPNNPDGKVLSRGQVEALAEFALRHDLWVFSDEVYQDYVYDGRSHLSIASLPDMAERTLAVFSFSKSYGLAGARVGYVAGPADVMGHLRRVANHSVYNVSAAMQYVALQALRHGQAFLEEARRTYLEARRLLVEGLAGARFPLPEGGAYLWLELDSEEAAWELVDRALQQGLALAPGEAFGRDYKHCLRLCFTAAPPAEVARAAAILRPLLGLG
jgi:aspartate/methionine/tyrosine aminotransferase